MLHQQQDVVRQLPGAEYEGLVVSELALRDRGCSLLAIERDGAFVEFTAETRVEVDDVLYVCGTR